MVRAFVADIPELNPEQLAKLYEWSKNKFEHSDIQMNTDGSHLFCAICPDGTKDLRSWQRLLRTNLLNWKIALPKAQKGWVREIPQDDDALLPSPSHENAPPLEATEMSRHDFQSLLKVPCNLLRNPEAFARLHEIAVH